MFALTGIVLQVTLSSLGEVNSSGSRNFGEGGPRNMKYKPPRSAAIFFWPIFTRQGGGQGGHGSATGQVSRCCIISGSGAI